jgi:hypothetical protein
MTPVDLSSTASSSPVQCQPWCQEGDGHPDEGTPEDQWCFGVEHRVHLSTEPTVLMADASMQEQYLCTYLLRHADDTAPRVFIGFEQECGRSATLDEARRFALAVLARVDGHEV